MALGGCHTQLGGGHTRTRPPRAPTPTPPCSYLSRSDVHHAVAAGGLAQPLQELRGEEGIWGELGGVVGGCGLRGGGGGGTHLAQAPDLVLLFGLDMAAEQGVQVRALAGGAWGPPRASPGAGEGAGSGGEGQEGEGPGGPRPPRAPQEPGQLRGGGGGQGRLPGWGELRPQPLGEEILQGGGVSGEGGRWWGDTGGVRGTLTMT